MTLSDADRPRQPAKQQRVVYLGKHESGNPHPTEQADDYQPRHEGRAA